MVTIKMPGQKDVKLSEIEFNALVQGLYKHLQYGSGGMFGDGQDISDKSGYARAERIIKKLGYRLD